MIKKYAIALTALYVVEVMVIFGHFERGLLTSLGLALVFHSGALLCLFCFIVFFNACKRDKHEQLGTVDRQ